MTKPVTYDDVVRMLKSNTGLLLDVRSKEELEAHGCYPKYLLVPHTEIAEAMQLSEAEFKRRYHGDKPKKDDAITVTCMSGRRAGLAAEELIKLEFTNVSVYTGSFNDWKAQQIDPAKAYKN